MFGSCNDSPWSDCATPSTPDILLYMRTSSSPLTSAQVALLHGSSPINHHSVSDPLIQMLRRWILKYLCLTALSIFSSNSLATNTPRKKESILLKLIPTYLSTCKFLFRKTNQRQIHCVRRDIVNALCLSVIKRKEDDEIWTIIT